MTEKSDPNFMTPFTLWRSFQEANMEAWSQGMAALVYTDVYAEAMRNFLDSYLTTSAPFRKVMDQYMAICLANINMPSRDEIARLEQRMMTVEMRLNTLSGQLDQLLMILQGQTTQVMSLTSEHTAGIEQLESHTHELDSKTDHLIRLLEEQKAALIALAKQQQSAPDDTATTQAIIAKTEHIASLLQAQQAQIDTITTTNTAHNVQLERLVQTWENTRQEVTGLIERQQAQTAHQTIQHQQTEQADRQQRETRLSALETRVEELTTLLQEQLVPTIETSTSSQVTNLADMEKRVVDNLQTTMSQIHTLIQEQAHLQAQAQQSSAQQQPQQSTLSLATPTTATLSAEEDDNAEIAQLESHIQSLDEKTEQVLETLQMLQTKLQTAAPATPRTRKTTTKKPKSAAPVTQTTAETADAGAESQSAAGT